MLTVMRDMETHHSVRFNAIDEDGHWADAVLLKAAHKLRDVALLRDDMLAIEQDGHSGRVRPVPQRPMLGIPGQVLCGRAKVPIIVRVQTACVATMHTDYGGRLNLQGEAAVAGCLTRLVTVNSHAKPASTQQPPHMKTRTVTFMLCPVLRMTPWNEHIAAGHAKKSWVTFKQAGELL